MAPKTWTRMGILWMLLSIAICFPIRPRSLQSSLTEIRSGTFDKSSSIQSLFSSVSKSEVSQQSDPITQGMPQQNAGGVPQNYQQPQVKAKLDSPLAEPMIANIPRTKFIAIFIAPILVFILIIIAVWTLYQKGVLTGCVKRKKKGSNARSRLLQEQLRQEASINSLLNPYYKIKSQYSESIPEFSEWLESVHGSDDEENNIPFPGTNNSPSVASGFHSINIKSLAITEPEAVLSTSSDLKSIQKSTLFNHDGSFGTVYQNTHILRPQDGNIWKLGALKYSREKSNTLVTPSPSEDKIAVKRSWWQAPRTPSSTESDHNDTRSWWSKKASIAKQETSMELDNFHVW